MKNDAVTFDAVPDAQDTPTISVEQAARFLGISRGAAYGAVADGSLPAIRVGPKRLRVPTATLRKMLGLES